ncbi:MAG: putative motility protein [Spirochaetia bacterium]
METGAITAGGNNMLLQEVSVRMLKNSLDFQQKSAMQLMQSLPKLQDKAVGNIVDTYA